MFSVRKPSPEEVQAFLDAQKDAELSYAQVGASKDTPPRGYRVDHHRVQLGEGENTYSKAIKALYDWRMYETGWTFMHPHDPPVTKGATIVILAHHAGLWSLNGCRIVYKLDAKHPVRRCGFAIGTLQDHAERGEERFLVEWDPRDDAVWFDILAFSRHHQTLAKVGFPVANAIQRRFVKDAQDAMQRAVRT
jgi:uncharacterized protein (UPF0548 family)